MDSNIKEEAKKHATNWGMMAYVFPEKEESFIIGALSESAKDYWFKQFKEQPQDTTEKPSLDDLLNKHAKTHMVDWDLERFKISHRRLYTTLKDVFDDVTNKK